jgi:hypothetical protein
MIAVLIQITSSDVLLDWCSDVLLDWCVLVFVQLKGNLEVEAAGTCKPKNQHLIIGNQ